MVRNADWKDTYCSPGEGNVRYPSDAKEAVDGWAYMFTKDEAVPADMRSKRHAAQVRVGNSWVAYSGYLPSYDEAFGVIDTLPEFEPDETPDPNY